MFYAKHYILKLRVLKSRFSARSCLVHDVCDVLRASRNSPIVKLVYVLFSRSLILFYSGYHRHWVCRQQTELEIHSGWKSVNWSRTRQPGAEPRPARIRIPHRLRGCDSSRYRSVADRNNRWYRTAWISTRPPSLPLAESPRRFLQSWTIPRRWVNTERSLRRKR